MNSNRAQFHSNDFKLPYSTVMSLVLISLFVSGCSSIRKKSQFDGYEKCESPLKVLEKYLDLDLEGARLEPDSENAKNMLRLTTEDTLPEFDTAIVTRDYSMASCEILTENESQRSVINVDFEVLGNSTASQPSGFPSFEIGYRKVQNRFELNLRNSIWLVNSKLVGRPHISKDAAILELKNLKSEDPTFLEAAAMAIKSIERTEELAAQSLERKK
jgi:hypothetical protein